MTLDLERFEQTPLNREPFEYQKGKVLPPKMEHEIALESAPIPQRWLYRLFDQPPRILGGVRIGRFVSGGIGEGGRLVSGTRISERKAVQHAARSGREPLSTRATATPFPRGFCRCVNQAKGGAYPD